MISNTAFSQTNPAANSPRNSPSLAGEITNLNTELGNFEDTAIQGYIQEGATVTYLANNSFSTTGNTTSFYTRGRLLRLNRAGTPIYVTVQSSSYNGVITTVTTYETTITNPVNTVDLTIQPKGFTNTPVNAIKFGGSSGQYLKSNGDGTITYAGLIVNRGFSWFVAGSPGVGNDLSLDYTAPEAMTAVKLWLHSQVAPTGSSVILRIFNVTQNAAVATITLNTGTTDVNTTTFTTPAINAGDVLRIDCTQADSNLVGVNFTAVLECTQP